MKSARRKGAESLLKIAIVLCLGYSAFRAGEFIADHVPPYSEGTCLRLAERPNNGIYLKIEKNHYIAGISDAAIYILSMKVQPVRVTFKEQRESTSVLVKTDCL